MSESEVEEPAESNKFALIPKIMNGGIAGIIGVTCTFPLDLVKTRLQSQQAGPGGEPMYSSLFDCFKKTIRAEGFTGMYRGSFVNILFVTPEKAIKLSANDYFRHKLGSVDGGSLSWPLQMVAGGGAGMLQIFITTPMELVKIQMQTAGSIEATQKGGTRVTGLSICRRVIQEHGIFGLYRGIGPTALRDVSFSLIYFPLFAELNDLGPRNRDGSGNIVFWYSFLAGMAAACSAAFMVTPLDVVKTRMQTLQKAAGAQEFHGIADCFRKTLHSEGTKALFKGGLCRMAVIAPFFGIAQMIYLMDVAEKLLAALL